MTFQGGRHAWFGAPTHEEVSGMLNGIVHVTIWQMGVCVCVGACVLRQE